MPTSSRLRELDRQLGLIVRPALEPLGFLGGSRRSYRRIREAEHGTLVHIVHFQVGIKSLAGQFTTNLVVYHSAFCLHPGAVSQDAATFGDGFLTQWTRIAKLAPPRRSRLQKLLGQTPEPDDRWCPQSANPTEMAAALEEPLALVLAYAPEWFDRHGTEAACRAEFERVRARQHGRSSSEEDSPQ